MALSVTEFLAPVGPINAARVFPGEDAPALGVRFTGYIAAGTAAAAKLATATADQRDVIARLYVIYRAYDDVVDRMALSPATFTAVDEGTVTFSAAQLKVMTEKRDAAYSDYVDAVAAAGLEVGPTDTRATVSVRAIPRF